MIKAYRYAQKWGHWLTHFPGSSILKMENDFLVKSLKDPYIKHALLIGVPEQQFLFKKISVINNPIVLSPLINQNKYPHYIESGYYELPITPGSVDLVILPHTLEFIDNPRQLLNEACRVVKPEGDIIIFGFNPTSLWGFKKRLMKNKNTPWSGNFISPHVVKQWLQLADFQLVQQNMMLFRPPLQKSIFKKLHFLERIGASCNAFFGGIFVIRAKAKVIPLTPIKLNWKQKLPALSMTISGPSIRNSR